MSTPTEPSPDAAAKAQAFANGLRKNIAASGRRWAQWPGGAAGLAHILAAIDGIQQRLREGADVPASIADLRTILEWTTYQSGAVNTARALLTARKTSEFAERFGLLDDPAARSSILRDSEESLIDNIRTRNEYMQTLADRAPHLNLPRPLVDVEALARKPEPKKPNKLALIKQLRESTKKK